MVVCSITKTCLASYSSLCLLHHFTHWIADAAEHSALSQLDAYSLEPSPCLHVSVSMPGDGLSLHTAYAGSRLSLLTMFSPTHRFPYIPLVLRPVWRIRKQWLFSYELYILHLDRLLHRLLGPSTLIRHNRCLSDASSEPNESTASFTNASLYYRSAKHWRSGALLSEGDMPVDNGGNGDGNVPRRDGCSRRQGLRKRSSTLQVGHSEFCIIRGVRWALRQK